MRTIPSPRPYLPALLFSILLVSTIASAEDWPHWRGPREDMTSAETDVPTEWSWTETDDGVESKNIKWRCALPEWGDSTPIIIGDAIFLTSHEDDERLLLLRIDRRDGKIVWTREVGRDSAPRNSERDRIDTKFHREQNMATPSVATDGELLAVHFGNGDLAMYDYDGRELWKRNMQEEHGPYTIWWGHANTPVLFDDLVIVLSMQDSCHDLLDKPAESYIVAYDKRTGEQRWKTLRMTGATAEHCDSYTTPLFWERDGRTEMLVMGGEVLDGYDPATGKQLWTLEGLVGNRVITGPTAKDGVVYTTLGQRGATLAIRPSGLGEQSRDAILWSNEDNTPDSPTPVVAEGLVFTVSDNGIAKCMDAETGETLWEQRLKGAHRSSPLYADGNIYFLSTRGGGTVVRAARQCEIVAENEIDDMFFASPVVSRGDLFIRGQKALYCVGE